MIFQKQNTPVHGLIQGLYFFLFLLLAGCQHSSDDLSTDEFLKEHVEWLASDDKNGRLAGTLGEAAAANYISDRFLQYGLQPMVNLERFVQLFELTGPVAEAMGVENHISRNIAGGVYGHTHPGRFIVIGAHYDGQGPGGVISMDANNEAVLHLSADDNASGTAGLLWLAERFSRDPARNTLLFVAFSGEELGLLGARHFADTMDMEKDSVLAMINMDMIGRLTDQQLHIFGTGTANIWDQLLDEIPADSLEITTTPGGMGSSDHAAFYEAGIPVLHYFTGTHPDYHRPSDTPDKINYQGMKQVLTHIERTIRKLDEFGPGDIEFSESTDQRGVTMRRDGVTLGVMPDYNWSGDGFRIESVREGTPADSAGIRGGDIIIGMQNRKISDIYQYMEQLNEFAKGDEMVLQILRDDEEIEVLVRF